LLHAQWKVPLQMLLLQGVDFEFQTNSLYGWSATFDNVWKYRRCKHSFTLNVLIYPLWNLQFSSTWSSFALSISQNEDTFVLLFFCLLLFVNIPFSLINQNHDVLRYVYQLWYSTRPETEIVKCQWWWLSATNFLNE
jgi:hypothetical protein